MGKVCVLLLLLALSGFFVGAALAQSADVTPPTVVRVATTTAPHADIWGSGEVIEFTVTFSEPVQLAPDRRAPTLALRIGGSPRGASLARGGGTTELVFGYRVEAWDFGEISIPSDALQPPGAIVDFAGNAFSGTFPALVAGAAGAVDGDGAASPVELVVERYRMLAPYDSLRPFAAEGGRSLSESVNNDPDDFYNTFVRVRPVLPRGNSPVFLKGLRLAPTSEMSLADFRSTADCALGALAGDGSAFARAHGADLTDEPLVECWTRADGVVEGLETMVWEMEYALSADGRSHVVRSQAVRVYDADRAQVELGPVAATMEEGATLRLPIRLTRRAAFDVHVRWRVLFADGPDGAALASAEDFAGRRVAGVARIPAGETQVEVRLETQDESREAGAANARPEPEEERFTVAITGVYEDRTGTVAMGDECASSVSARNVPVLRTCVAIERGASTATVALRGIDERSGVFVTGGEGLSQEESTRGRARFTADEGARVALTATSTGLTAPVAWRWRQSARDPVQVLNELAVERSALALVLPRREESYIVTLTVTATEHGGDFTHAIVTIDVPNENGICDRTPAVRDAIVRALADLDHCAAVTAADLATLTGKLYLDDENIVQLQPGDFAGLVSLTELNLSDNPLRALPRGIFAGLDALETLQLYEVRVPLHAGMFAGLPSLVSVDLSDNHLRSMPGDLFDEVPLLQRINLGYNELTTLPRGLFEGLELKRLWMRNNRFERLPEGMFTHLAGTGFELLDVSLNPKDGPRALPLTMTLEQARDVWGVVVRIAEGAPANLTLTLDVDGTPDTVVVPFGADRATHPVTAPAGAVVTLAGTFSGLEDPPPTLNGNVSGALNTPFRGIDSRISPAQSVVLENGIAVSVTAVNAMVTDPADMIFRVTASAPPASDLEVGLRVHGPYFGWDVHRETVTIRAGTTTSDWQPETLGPRDSHMPLFVTVVDADGYHVGRPASAAATVESAMPPPSGHFRVSIETDTPSVKEGGEAMFALRLDRAASDDLTVWVGERSVSPSGSSQYTFRPVAFNAGEDEATLVVTVREDDERFQGNEALTAHFAHSLYNFSMFAAGTSSAAAVTVWDDEQAPTRIALSATPDEVTDVDGETSVTVTAELVGGAPLATTTQVAVALSSSGPAETSFAPERFTIAIEAGERTGAARFTLTPAAETGSNPGDAMVRISGTHAWLEIDPAAVWILRPSFTPEINIGAGAGLVARGAASDGALRFDAVEDTRVTLVASSTDLLETATFSWSQAPDDEVRLVEAELADGSSRLSLTLPNRSQPYTLRLTATATHASGSRSLLRSATRDVILRVAADDDARTIGDAMVEVAGGEAIVAAATATVGDFIVLRVAVNEPDEDQSLLLAWSGPPEILLMTPDRARPGEVVFTAPDISGVRTFTFSVDDGGAGGAITREAVLTVMGSLNVTGGEGIFGPQRGDGRFHFATGEGRTVTLTGALRGASSTVEWRWAQNAADEVRVLAEDSTDAALTLNLPLRHEGYALTFTVTAVEEGLDALDAVVTLAVGNLDGICDRTQAVYGAILALLPDISDCGDVTAAHLNSIGAGPGSVALRIQNHADLEELKPHDFAGLTSLETLALGGNGLQSLPAGVFSELDSLEFLSLSGNRLTSLPADLFSGLSALEQLELSGNELTALPSEVFSGLISLRDLNLSRNDLESLPGAVFRGLVSLWDLDLNSNDLRELPSGLFAGLDSLEIIRLRENDLRSLPFGALAQLRLRDLDLQRNGFQNLPMGIFTSIQRLGRFRFNSNPLNMVESDGEKLHPFTVLMSPAKDRFGLTVQIMQGVPATTTLALVVEGQRHELVFPPGQDRMSWYPQERLWGVAVTLEEGTVGRPALGATGVDFDFPSQSWNFPERVAVSISTSSPTVVEGGTATFTLQTDPPAARNLRVIVDLSATGGFEIGALTRTVDIEWHERGRKVFSVDVENDPKRIEDGVLTARVRARDDYVLGTPSVARMTIADRNRAEAASRDAPGQNVVPDVNGDGQVNANDALVLYYAFSLGSVLGSGR